MLVSDAGDGSTPPVEERFATGLGADGLATLGYIGPASALPYAVRWPAGRSEVRDST